MLQPNVPPQISSLAFSHAPVNRIGQRLAWYMLTKDIVLVFCPDVVVSNVFLARHLLAQEAVEGAGVPVLMPSVQVPFKHQLWLTAA